MNFYIYTIFLSVFVQLSYEQADDCFNSLESCLSNGKKCNFSVTNPKMVINPYKNKMEDYVQPKPFSSVCLRCSMCLAISKEFQDIFNEVMKENAQLSKHGILKGLLEEKLGCLCTRGFENYDLRQFKDYKIVIDEHQCGSHVRTHADGKWTEKLREMCRLYLDYTDVLYLLNEYLKNTANMQNYLCKNSGVLRDCSSLNITRALADDSNGWNIDDYFPEFCK